MSGLNGQETKSFTAKAPRTPHLNRQDAKDAKKVLIFKV
jgi:hypothetical protein